MSVRLEAISFEAGNPVALGAFWGALLGREVIHEDDGVRVPGDRLQVGLRFVQEAAEKRARNRLHLHLTSQSLEDQRQIVESVVRLGGGRLGTGPLPIGRDVYLTDPEGSEICVIEPTNSYLAGTALLGEVTCDGTRAAGNFWRDVLGWTVVWDEGDQLALQSPDGGTKVAWDAWPDGKTEGWNRQRFELATEAFDAEIERLVFLGATRVGTVGDAVVMTDPDGSEFVLTLAR